MEPAFMYWNDAKFEGDTNFKKFSVDFSDGDRLEGVYFRKDKNYYITSLTTNIKIEQDLKKLSDYKKITEISKKLNDVIKNGSQHLYDEIELEIKDVNELLPIKTKRKISTRTLNFFDEKTKKQKKVLIYLPYKELKFFGLKFEKENAIINKYQIYLIEDKKNNFFLEKKLYYDKNKILEELKKKNNYENLIFMEDKGKLIVQPIEIADFLSRNIENLKGKKIDYYNLWKNHSEFKSDFYHILFGEDPLKPAKKRPKIFQKGTSVNDSHPIAYEYNGTIKIKAGVNFYITKELYDRKQSIFRKIPEIPEKIVTNAELTDLRRQLNDDSFSISKLFGFRNKKDSIYPALRPSDFSIPDFNVKVETKKASSDIQKKIFEGSFFILDNDYNQSKKTEIISADKRVAVIKNTFSNEAMKYLEKDYNEMKKLSDEINLQSLNLIYENFFLYDLDNFIQPSFTTELQTEFSIYGLINFSNDVKKEEEKLDIISPRNFLKFKTINDTRKNKLNLELTKVHTKKTFDIKDQKIYNFGILCTENERIGTKRKMSEKIIDTIKVIGIQKTDYSYLNPVHIHIKSESIIRRLMLKKNNKYKFVLTSLIFSSNIINDTKAIFLVSDGLNDAKKIFIKENLVSCIGVCYLSEIKNWNLIKGQSKRVQAVFNDSEKITAGCSHFALTFKTINLSDILKFSITLVDGENKPIKFKDGEKNVPIINFDIEILEE